MKFQALVRMATTLALLAGISVLPGNVCAQVIDFSQIDAFEIHGDGDATRCVTTEDYCR
jgi:hypothetical protein